VVLDLVDVMVAPASAAPEQRGAVSSPPSPVFVLAPARSCSSIAVAMLGGHPQLYAFPELRLFRVDKVAEMLVDPPPGRGMPVGERVAGLLRALALLHEGAQTPVAIEHARAWLAERAAWPTHQVLDHLLALVDPRIGVEKSPESSLSWEALSRVGSAYPRARYIHLVRHPWSTVASMIRAWGALPYWGVAPEAAPEYCAALWVEQHRRIEAFTSQLEPGHHVRTRAEQLVNHPESVLPALCGWLDLQSGPVELELMSSPERSPYARPGPDNAWGGYDPTFLRSPERRPVATPDTLQAPGHWPISAQTQSAVAGLAAEFGYPCRADPQQDQPPVARSGYSGTLGRLRMANRTPAVRHA
jgi:hypothetical protein